MSKLYLIKTIEKVEIASDKNRKKPIDLHFTRKNLGPVFIDND